MTWTYMYQIVCDAVTVSWFICTYMNGDLLCKQQHCVEESWRAMVVLCTFHPAGRALTSDRSINIFLYWFSLRKKDFSHTLDRKFLLNCKENVLIDNYHKTQKKFSHTLDSKFWLNFKENFLIDNHHKNICRLVKSECSSCTVFILLCSPCYDMLLAFLWGAGI